ncbi:Blue light- and temperature-regulated antirepressor BluF [Roseobacter fucihabitans]|uniref:Blue light- and temperature-regulated antirepressor BluF n=2 Tax=Roseobacter fucihabitans TaxID=1537242 RepID=A0ABZ2BZ37_9RHOB|nr:Blue light- and temperature-regulated antirepressor YcgF [Roseobacter litoralis]
MAFQPIFDLQTGAVFAQEALVRGKDGRGAGEIFSHVTDHNRYQFDQRCRTTAIEVATEAGLQGALSINFMPNAVYEPRHCITHTLWAADKCNFDIGNLIFEFTECEPMRDIQHIKNIVATYKQFGFRTAIDDFGAGYAGLTLLADVIPDLIKLDRGLVTNIDKDPGRQSIVASITALCGDLGIEVIAEGIETADEFAQLRDLGIQYIQGYYLARPQFEQLQTEPNIPFLALKAETDPTHEILR